MTDDQGVPDDYGIEAAELAAEHFDRWYLESDVALRMDADPHELQEAFVIGWEHAGPVLRAQGAATEREACAKLAEREAAELRGVAALAAATAKRIADLIRARTTP